MENQRVPESNQEITGDSLLKIIGLKEVQLQSLREVINELTVRINNLNQKHQAKDIELANLHKKLTEIENK